MPVLQVERRLVFVVVIVGVVLVGMMPEMMVDVQLVVEKVSRQTFWSFSLAFFVYFLFGRVRVTSSELWLPRIGKKKGFGFIPISSRKVGELRKNKEG